MVRTLIQTDGGAVSAPPFGLSTIGALGALLVFALSGTGLAGPGITLAAALAIILLGLPHGAYDLQLLVKPRPGRRLPDWRLAAAYLGLLGCATRTRRFSRLADHLGDRQVASPAGAPRPAGPGDFPSGGGAVGDGAANVLVGDSLAETDEHGRDYGDFESQFQDRNGPGQ